MTHIYSMHCWRESCVCVRRGDRKDDDNQVICEPEIDEDNPILEA